MQNSVSAVDVAWTDTAAVPVRRPTRSGGCGRVERCETWLTAPLPPTRRRMRWPRPSSADAKAYLSSREAQEMSGERARTGAAPTGPGVDAQAPARTVRSRGPTMSSARSGACRNATRRRPSGRCRLPGWVALVDGAETQLDLASARRRPYGVVIDLIHVAEYVCKAVPVFHRHRRHRRGVRYLVRNRMGFTGARWCYTVPLFHPCAGPDPPGGQLGWSRGGSEASGATKPAATSMRTGTSTTREYQRHHAQRYADGIARPVSKPPPPPSPPRLRRVK